VFLGPVQVFPAGTAAAILYFAGAVDNEWTTVGNWWLDASHTQAAGRLPTSDESVVVSASITASGQTVVNFTIANPTSLGGTLTVTGMATFNDNSTNSGTITGNATFNGSSVNAGTVIGNATLNDASDIEPEFGTVTGTITDNRP
jgi:hypothetical protein